MNFLFKHKIKLIFISLIIALLLLISLLLSKEPYVSQVQIHPQEVKKAVQEYKNVSNAMFDSDAIEVSLGIESLSSIFKAASYLTPKVNVAVEVSGSAVGIYGSLDVGTLFSQRYVNFYCLVIAGNRNAIDSCDIGSLTLPGGLVKWSANFLLRIFFDRGVSDVFNQFLRNFHIEDGVLYLTADSAIDLKSNIKAGLSNVSDIATYFKRDYGSDFSPEIINDYLEYMLTDSMIVSGTNIPLSRIIRTAFEYAAQRSRDNNAMKENEYALWSIAIAFANHRFAEILAVNTNVVGNSVSRFSSKNAMLGERTDLALHFLYSAIIERVGTETIANSVGELKELFDANQGGSGFDLADIAADMAGARFAYFISSSQSNAEYAQRTLSNHTDESVLFPNANRYGRFKLDDDGIDLKTSQSNRYSEAINRVKEDIDNLPLYRLDDSKNPSRQINVQNNIPQLIQE